MSALADEEALSLGGQEISREEAILAYLKSEEVHDFTLEGNDGISFGANRYMLAARSSVFKKMLLGAFKEASSNSVQLDYPGAVLKSLVEYVYFDTADDLLALPMNPSANNLPSSMVRIESLVTLAAAAVYFNLPGLCKHCFDSVSKFLEEMPALSFALLEACVQHGPLIPDEFGELAKTELCKNVHEAVSSVAVSILSATTLQKVLEEPETGIDEFKLFEILRLWANHTAAQESDIAENCSRRSIVSALAGYIRLECINPQLLSTVVTSSDLFTPEQLLQAFQKQALAAQETHGVFFNCKRSRFTAPLWKSSKSELSTSTAEDHYEVDFLEMPPIVSGICQWTIKVEKDATSTWATWIGIASNLDSLDMSRWLGSQDYGWVYGSHGLAFHANKGIRRHARFACNSQMTLTLNLLPGSEQNGTLSASVGDEPSFQLFSGLRDWLGGEGGGFVPAVSLRAPGRVRLIEFIRLKK
jgi:hypothetical protein